MPDIYSVGELTALIKTRFEENFPFVWVRGQVSNLARPSSGHLYFTLKDKDACLNVVWFKGSQRGGAGGHDPLTGEVFGGGFESGTQRLSRVLENGQEILCGGSLTVYPPRGSYQLIAQLVQDVGLGKLYLEFEALKKALTEKGYFDAQRKRPLPGQVRRVVVVTAATGAAIHDFIKIARTRGLRSEIRLYPSLVQGNEAPESIAGAMQLALRDNWAQVLVLIRGGGSLEDLWAFNTEPVAQAVYESPIPVLAGIGHEVDVSITDMVADVRAATPSHAAQLLWPERQRMVQDVDTAEMSLRTAWERWLRSIERELEALQKSLSLLSPKGRLDRAMERTEDLAPRLQRAAKSYFSGRSLLLERLSERLQRSFGPEVIQERSMRLELLSGRLRHAGENLFTQRTQLLEHQALKLDSLNPMLPLERGYSLVRRQDGSIVRDARGLAAGDLLDIRLAHGTAEARVVASHPEAENTRKAVRPEEKNAGGHDPDEIQ